MPAWESIWAADRPPITRPAPSGPNDYQNYPGLTIAQSDGDQTVIQGTLYESPNSSYMLQFFSSPTADPSGHGQGKVLIGVRECHDR